MNKIKNVKLFIRDDEKTKVIEEIIKGKLEANGFLVRDKDIDLAIAIGGDGTFLRMIKETAFSSDILYVGINTGTLGFLQEVKIDEIDLFIKEMINGYYKVEEIGIQETTIVHKNGTSKFYSFNEIIIRDYQLKAVQLDIKIDNKLLEHFIGDGLLIASSSGSTAHNLSYNGAIVYNTFSSLQITPLAPINSKVYKSLVNSVIIPDKMCIKIEPTNNKQTLLLTIDGENHNFKEVTEIRTTINSKKIKCIRLSKYNFIEKINEKLLTFKDL